MPILLLLLTLAQPAPPPVDVRMVPDEADAVLHILGKKGQGVTEEDWQRLFSSEGYVRLKKRDTQMGRPFEDADFRTFVLSDDLAKRAPDLTRTLGLWTAVDPAAAARRALAYLPEGAHIRAKVYPVVKPKDNSFVFEVKTDPAIFLYLDPAVPPEKLENTLAHELHHIGFGGSCPSPAVEAEIANLPEATRTALLWMGAFGEGIAMLAAAGGPGVHPHAVSPPADRERWDRDVARFPEDLRKLDAFFRDVLAGKLAGEEAQTAAMGFFGEQGPWYTVGWKMAATIEKALGRDRLVAAACDPRRLLPDYGEAARKLGGEMPVWSEEVVKMGAGSPASPQARSSGGWRHVRFCLPRPDGKRTNPDETLGDADDGTLLKSLPALGQNSLKMPVHTFGSHVTETEDHHARQMSAARGNQLGEVEILGQQDVALLTRHLEDQGIGKCIEPSFVKMDGFVSDAAQEGSRFRGDPHVEQELHAGIGSTGRTVS